MSFQETTSVSWLGRIKRSLGGLLVGLLLIVSMVVLLFWNEGRAVTTHRSLTEGAGLVVSIDAGRIDPAQEGALVHAAGQVATMQRPADPAFGVAADGLRLIRSAEMYQWIETRKSETRTKLGGGEETVTTYSYATGWSDRVHDSSQFRQPEGRVNPTMEVRGQSFQVDSATLGAFSLSPRIIGMIGGAKPLPLGAERLDDIQAAIGAGARARLSDGRIYIGADPQRPQVGDYRIGYEVVPVGPASIVGRQAGSGFEPFQTRAGNALLMIETGLVPAEQMFSDAMASNTVITWIIRVVGMVFLIAGFSLVMAPLGVLGDVIPFVGSIVRMGTGLIAAVLGILVGTATIAIAWFWYRPLTALIILAMGCAVAFAIARFARKRRVAGDGVPPAAAPPAQPA